MKLQDSFEIEAPAEQIWEFLLDAYPAPKTLKKLSQTSIKEN